MSRVCEIVRIVNTAVQHIPYDGLLFNVSFTLLIPLSFMVASLALALYDSSNAIDATFGDMG